MLLYINNILLININNIINDNINVCVLYINVIINKC